MSVQQLVSNFILKIKTSLHAGLCALCSDKINIVVMIDLGFVDPLCWSKEVLLALGLGRRLGQRTKRQRELEEENGVSWAKKNIEKLYRKGLLLLVSINSIVWAAQNRAVY